MKCATVQPGRDSCRCFNASEPHLLIAMTWVYIPNDVEEPPSLNTHFFLPESSIALHEYWKELWQQPTKKGKCSQEHYYPVTSADQSLAGQCTASICCRGKKHSTICHSLDTCLQCSKDQDSQTYPRTRVRHITFTTVRLMSRKHSPERRQRIHKSSITSSSFKVTRVEKVQCQFDNAAKEHTKSHLAYNASSPLLKYCNANERVHCCRAKVQQPVADET